MMLKRCPKCGDPRGDAGGLMCQANGCLLVDGGQQEDPRDAEIVALEAEIARLTSVLVEKETCIAQLLDEISRWELVTLRNGK